MLNSGVLDVVIGLVFIFLLYSLLASIVQEFIATWFSFRAKILERAIVRMLEDKIKIPSRFKSVYYLFKKNSSGRESGDASGAFYDHPLIKFLGENKSNDQPSYINRETFSKVMIDLLRGAEVKPGDNVRSLIQGALDGKEIKWIPGTNPVTIAPQTLSYLKSLWADAQGDVEKFRSSLEDWFDETMERATGWYKKNTQVILLIIGMFIAVVFNVDTIRIASKLQKDPKLREQVVQQADAFIKAHPDLDKELQQQQDQLDKLSAEVKKKDTAVGTLSELQARKKEDSADMVKNEKLRAMRDTLITRANSLLNNDLGKAGNLLGLGWSNAPCAACDFWCFLSTLAGWIITALAISLGAPFWFDMLSKLMKVRGSVAATATPEKQPGSENRSQKINTVG